MRARNVIAAAVLALGAAAAACASILGAGDLTCSAPKATGSIDMCLGNDGVTIYATSGQLNDVLWIGDEAGTILGAGSKPSGDASLFAVQLLTPTAAVGSPSLDSIGTSANAIVSQSAVQAVVVGGSGANVVVNRYLVVPTLGKVGTTQFPNGTPSGAKLREGVAASGEGFNGVVVYATTNAYDLDVLRVALGVTPPTNSDDLYNGSATLLRATGGVANFVDGGRVLIIGEGVTGPPGLVMVAFQTQSSALDLRFGDAGVVTDPFMGGHARAIILQGQSYWVAGEAADAGGMIVAHFNGDGTLDTTYGQAGFAVASGTNRGANAIIDVQTGLLVAGYDQGRLAIARFTYDAGVDPTFGEGGVVTLDVPGELRAIRPGDSKHYIAGGLANVDGGTSWVIVWLLR